MTPTYFEKKLQARSPIILLKRILSTFSALLLFSHLSYAEDADKPALVFYTENYPPANYMQDGELKGISVDTVRAIWRKMGVPEQSIELVPWARGYRFTLDNPNTVLFTMSKTHSRTDLFKWVGPIFNSTHVLIAKKSKNLAFENLGQVFYQSVVVVQGDISEISLHQVGFPEYNMAKVSELKQAYKMLEADRVDLMVVTIHAFAYLSELMDFDLDQYEQVWELNKIGNYMAFNINTPDVIVEKYQAAFDAINEERLAIKQRYSLPEAEY